MNDTTELEMPACAFVDPAGPVLFRGELLGLQRLEAHARALAAQGRQVLAEAGTPSALPFRGDSPTCCCQANEALNSMGKADGATRRRGGVAPR